MQINTLVKTHFIDLFTPRTTTITEDNYNDIYVNAHINGQ